MVERVFRRFSAGSTPAPATTTEWYNGITTSVRWMRVRPAFRLLKFTHMIYTMIRWVAILMLVASLTAAVYVILKLLGIPRDYCLVLTGFFTGALHSFLFKNETP